MSIPPETGTTNNCVTEFKQTHPTEPTFTASQVAEQVKAGEHAGLLELRRIYEKSGGNAWELLEDAIYAHVTDGALDRTIQSAVVKATGELFDQFWDVAALLGVPSGKYSPAALAQAIYAQGWQDRGEEPASCPAHPARAGEGSDT